jgi:glucokinase
MWTLIIHFRYGSKTTIEFEDICSGRGLVNVYEWTVKDTPDAAKGLKAQDGKYSVQSVATALCL